MIRDNYKLSEYQRLVEALGCTLEINIVLPNGEKLWRRRKRKYGRGSSKRFSGTPRPFLFLRLSDVNAAAFRLQTVTSPTMEKWMVRHSLLSYFSSMARAVVSRVKSKNFSYKLLHYAEKFLRPLTRLARLCLLSLKLRKRTVQNYGYIRKKKFDFNSTPYARKLS